MVEPEADVVAHAADATHDGHGHLGTENRHGDGFFLPSTTQKNIQTYPKYDGKTSIVGFSTNKNPTGLIGFFFNIKTMGFDLKNDQYLRMS